MRKPPVSLPTTKVMARSRNSWWWALPFAVIVVGLLAWTGNGYHYPIITEHNVAVYKQLPDGDWAMASDESGPFAYRPCPEDGKATSDMLQEAIGYIAERAVWEERGACKSLNGAGLNFYWRTANDEYRRIENARTSRSFPGNR
jgi:hypothetical protein